MHVLIGPEGRIVRVGPTLGRICAVPPLGRDLFDVLQICRPYEDARDVARLRTLAGTGLRLQLRGQDRLRLKGMVMVPAGGEMLLLNLSFGLSVIEAVRAFGLTNGDFAPTDLAIEMLYLVEAKTAVMEESRRLNARLHEAHRAAEEQALSDTLTGLRNRRAMEQRLSELVARGVPFGLMHVDLDYFKAVNDTFGHAAGDHVLQAAWPKVSLTALK